MPDQSRPRLLVLTDITSLESGVREPDDGQSLVRLLLYANDCEIEGLLAGSNLRHGQVTRPELIHQAIDAYADVLPSLRRHDPRYPDAALLHARVHAGQPVAERDVPVEASVGTGKDTPASDWIIAVGDRPDPRPVWVTVWGGTADLAQALWRVRQTRAPAALARFLAKLRIIAVHDQDSTGPWIKAEFPDLFYLTRNNGIRGMYRGGDTALSSSAWVETHIRQGHGALGALYPNYQGGDIWSKVTGIKEGDTPSFLMFIPNGLTDLDHLAWGGWGGRFAPESATRWTDAVAEDAAPDDPDPHMAHVYRWRAHFQADFAARLDWCVSPFEEANHAPVARVKGLPASPPAAGARITLDAGESYDVDGDSLRFTWEVCRYPDSFQGEVCLEGADTARLTLTLPALDAPLHLLLTVTDDGTPALRGYKRVVVG